VGNLLGSLLTNESQALLFCCTPFCEEINCLRIDENTQHARFCTHTAVMPLLLETSQTLYFSCNDACLIAQLIYI